MSSRRPAVALVLPVLVAGLLLGAGLPASGASPDRAPAASAAWTDVVSLRGAHVQGCMHAYTTPEGVQAYTPLVRLDGRKARITTTARASTVASGYTVSMDFHPVVKPGHVSGKGTSGGFSDQAYASGSLKVTLKAKEWPSHQARVDRVRRARRLLRAGRSRSLEATVSGSRAGRPR